LCIRNNGDMEMLGFVMPNIGKPNVAWRLFPV
jgi:hypothetical protein